MLGKIFRFFKTILERFGNLVSSIVNFVLMFLVYFSVVGIVSIIAKITGKNFFRKEGKESYWLDKKLSTLKKEDYYQMF